MMQERREQAATAQEPTPPVPATGGFTRPPHQVRVIAGADVQDLDLVGRRVGDARTVAQAIFGIHTEAVALVDGRTVGEDHVLGAGQLLEFVKHAGQKGAGSVIELNDDHAVWRRNGECLGRTSVRELLSRAGGAGGGRETWRLHPRHVRLMAERSRGRIVGVVVEMPPGPRQVRWVTDDSLVGYGPGTRCEIRHLSFPWVLLLLVFTGGELSAVQQAFYRTAPLGSLEDELYFTNMLNVAQGYGLESWICLVNLRRRLARLGWDERIHVVCAHVWEAAFTRSSEAHEGNSWWSTLRGLDPRLENPAAWEAATRANPFFALDVRWRPTGQSVGQTLERMLDMVAPCRPVERVEHLVTLLQQDEK